MSHINTVTIRAERLPDARKAMGKMVRKATRYGANVSYEIGEPFTRAQVSVCPFTGERHEYRTRHIKITVSGDAPRVGNYTFVSSVEFVNGQPVFNNVPGETVDKRFHTMGSDCEHCNTNRARRYLFIIRDEETGTQISVGKSCLRDYLGTDTPKSILHRFEMQKSLGGFGGEFQTIEPDYPLEQIITVTASVIRRFGWLSMRDAGHSDGKWSTANIVRLCLAPPPKLTQSECEIISAVRDGLTDKDETRAGDVIDWVRKSTDDNDYMHNLRVLFSDDYVSGLSRFGLVCSAVQSYLRHINEAAARQSLKDTSEWQGEIGKRIKNVKGWVTEYRFISESKFGSVYLVKIVDVKNNAYTWFTSSDNVADNGEPIKFNATVKQHNEYKGVKTTQLGRVSMKLDPKGTRRF